MEVICVKSEMNTFLGGIADNAGNSLFTATDDASLCTIIRNAHNRISFIGAGMSENIANAIVKKKSLVDTIVIDDDQRTFYNGYGTPKALQLLKSAGIDLLVGKNIRLNFLVIDQEALIYSPNALSIEDRPNEKCLNGICLDAKIVEPVFSSLREKRPVNFYQAHAIEKNHLVVKKMSQYEMKEKVESAAKHLPHYDLTRQLKVYQSRLQFIEIRLQGFNLKQHRVRIPQDLFQLSKRNKLAQGQLKASYQVFHDTGKLIHYTDQITAQVDELRKKYTVPLGSFGIVYLKENHQAIEKEKEAIQKRIDQKQEELIKLVDREFNAAKKEIGKLLYPLVRKNPPADFLRWNIPSDPDSIKAYIRERLDDEFGAPWKMVEGMQLKIIYKDITYEMLIDPAFNDAIKRSKLRYQFVSEGLFTEGVAPRSR